MGNRPGKPGRTDLCKLSFSRTGSSGPQEAATTRKSPRTRRSSSPSFSQATRGKLSVDDKGDMAVVDIDFEGDLNTSEKGPVSYYQSKAAEMFSDLALIILTPSLEGSANPANKDILRTCRILHASPSCREIMGYTPEELTDMPSECSRVIPGSETDTFLKLISIDSQKPCELLTFKHKLGHNVPVHVRSCRIPAPPHPKHADLNKQLDAMPQEIVESESETDGEKKAHCIQTKLIALYGREMSLIFKPITIDLPDKLSSNGSSPSTPSGQVSFFPTDDRAAVSALSSRLTRRESIDLTKIYKLAAIQQTVVKEGKRTSIKSAWRAQNRGSLKLDGREATNLLRNTPQKALSSRVKILPRGGLAIPTKVGFIQIGIPPETIKDSMNLGISVPTHFVVPEHMFNRECMINTAEFEFPAYFNFFILKKRVKLICTEEIAARIRIVFQETLLGPKDPDATQDFCESHLHMAPDFVKELGFFAKNPFNPSETMTVDTIIEFSFFNENGEVDLGQGVRVLVDRTLDDYVVTEDDAEVMRCSTDITLPEIGGPASQHIKPSAMALEASFQPPLFGVTFLGTSHGFDKDGTTTGFVLWVNRRGWMVDPPPRSGTVLRFYGIAPCLIEGVIVTHCHADHDAGTFHKILEDRRVTVLTTKTIMGSFLRKYSAITQIDVDILKRQFDFRPAIIGESMNVHGGKIKFFYSLHSIPCIGFECEYGDSSLVYSADTLNLPEKISEMAEKGVFSPGRRDWLLEFPFDKHDIILHEAGVPPIHTPLTTFEHLSDDIKERLYLVHCNEAAVTPEWKAKGLKRAKEGVEHSIIIDMKKQVPMSDAMVFLDLLGGTHLFRTLSPLKASELLQVFELRTFKQNEVIVPIGDSVGNVYLIISGVVECAGKYNTKYLSTGDYFGWKSFVSGVPNGFTRTCLNPVQTLVFGKSTLMRILEGTALMNTMKREVSAVLSPAWKAMDTNTILKKLNLNQKTVLEGCLERIAFKKGEHLMVAGKACHRSILIETGLVNISVSDEASKSRFDLISKFPDAGQRGIFICDVMYVLQMAELETWTAQYGVQKQYGMEEDSESEIEGYEGEEGDEGEEDSLDSAEELKKVRTTLMAKAIIPPKPEVVPQMLTVTTLDEGTMYIAKNKDLADFLHRFPGVMMRMLGHLAKY